MSVQVRPEQAIDLEDKLLTRTARVCVVGLGYVGLTVACALADTGFRVIGVDTDVRKVKDVRRGRYPLHGVEPGLPDVLARLVSAGTLQATTHVQAHVENADVVLVIVQTPVDPISHAPALDALRNAVISVGAGLRSNTLVVIESTIPPGTMRDLVVPLLEATSGLSAEHDFLVACCPERVMPGKLLSNLAECSRVVGGWTPRAGQMAAMLYRSIVHGDLDVTDCITAELVKTTENAYRDVQIAFANEVALICEDHAANVFDVRRLVNKSPHRDMHLPGAGVGGHCIPKDPWLLIAGTAASTPVRLIPAARTVNDWMPAHVGQFAEAALGECGRSISGSRIVVLGYAYLADSDDTRNSPSSVLVAWLQARGARVTVHDPHVPGLAIDLMQASIGADCLILMVAHSAYGNLDLAAIGGSMRTRVLIDGRHVVDTNSATSAGFVYRCVGVGR